jgi:hypothetical protein
VGHYSSFILRLWVEPPEGVRWGIIQHVATRDKLRFQTAGDGAMAVADVVEFIRQHSIEGEVSLPFVLDGSEPTMDSDGKSDTDEPQADAITEAETPENKS